MTLALRRRKNGKPSPFCIGGYAVIEHDGNELTNWEFIKAVLPTKTTAPSYARRHFFWRITILRENRWRGRRKARASFGSYIFDVGGDRAHSASVRAVVGTVDPQGLLDPRNLDREPVMHKLAILVGGGEQSGKQPREVAF